MYVTHRSKVETNSSELLSSAHRSRRASASAKARSRSILHAVYARCSSCCSAAAPWVDLAALLLAGDLLDTASRSAAPNATSHVRSDALELSSAAKASASEPPSSKLCRLPAAEAPPIAGCRCSSAAELAKETWCTNDGSAATASCGAGRAGRGESRGELIRGRLLRPGITTPGLARASGVCDRIRNCCNRFRVHTRFIIQRGHEHTRTGN